MNNYSYHDRAVIKDQNRGNHMEAALRKAQADTSYFWDMVRRQKAAALVGKPLQMHHSRRQSPAQEQAFLFAPKGSHDETGAVIDDNIPVQRSGPRSEEFPVLEEFDELSSLIPIFMTENIKRMGYKKPSAIQKHSIPVGLGGQDLMCCAQTGSGKTCAFLVPLLATIDGVYTHRSSSATVLESSQLKNGLSSNSTSDVTDTCVGGDSSPSSESCSPGPNDAIGSVPRSATEPQPQSAAPANKSETSLPNSEYVHAQDQEKKIAPISAHKSLGSCSDVPGRMSRESISELGALPLGIVLAPTRELASQIHVEVRRMVFGSSIKAVCVYGGSDVRAQLMELSSGCDLIIATPGRLNDLIDRGCVSLSQVHLLVLDEADRMLDMGFEPQIRRIVLDSDMPQREMRQTFMFSATFPAEIQAMAREFLRDYIWVAVGRVGSTVEGITQRIVHASSDSYAKLELLLEALPLTEGRTLVFVQKRRTASWLCETLNSEHRMHAVEIHGDRTQGQREHALRQFRDGHARLMIATDVAARGLDIANVTHVIQFDMPISSDDFDVYVHRIGRTGRAGCSGLATSFYVPGREVGEGNGKIAPLLLKLLQESQQDVPDWFAASDDVVAGHRGGGSVGRGGGYAGRGQYGTGRGGYNQYGRQQQQQYGGRGGGYGHNKPYYHGGADNGAYQIGVGDNQLGYGFDESSSGGVYGQGRGFDWGDVRQGQATTVYAPGVYDQQRVSASRPLQHQLPAHMLQYQHYQQQQQQAAMPMPMPMPVHAQQIGECYAAQAPVVSGAVAPSYGAYPPQQPYGHYSGGTDGFGYGTGNRGRGGGGGPHGSATYNAGARGGRGGMSSYGGRGGGRGGGGRGRGYDIQPGMPGMPEQFAAMGGGGRGYDTQPGMSGMPEQFAAMGLQQPGVEAPRAYPQVYGVAGVAVAPGYIAPGTAVNQQQYYPQQQMQMPDMKLTMQMHGNPPQA